MQVGPPHRGLCGRGGARDARRRRRLCSTPTGPARRLAAVDRVRRDPALLDRLVGAGRPAAAAPSTPSRTAGPVRRGPRAAGHRPAGAGCMKLAFVTPRYGIGGHRGSRDRRPHAGRAPGRRPGWEVEVMTSCALDHLTWENSEPRGHLGPQRGHRPPVPHGQPPAPRLLRARRQAAGGPETATLEESRRWVALNGPMCPGLVDAVADTDADVVACYPVPVRHHRGRHRRLQGPHRPPSRRPTTSPPSTFVPSARASGTSTGSSTTPGPSGT